MKKLPAVMEFLVMFITFLVSLGLHKVAGIRIV